jgi:hypothetical protein
VVAKNIIQSQREAKNFRAKSWFERLDIGFHGGAKQNW